MSPKVGLIGIFLFIFEGGGNVKIENRKLDFSSVKPKIPAAENITHKPGGGDKKVQK